MSFGALDIDKHVYACPCYTAKTVVKIFFHSHWGLDPSPLWLRLCKSVDTCA